MSDSVRSRLPNFGCSVSPPGTPASRDRLGCDVQYASSVGAVATARRRRRHQLLRSPSLQLAHGRAARGVQYASSVDVVTAARRRHHRRRSHPPAKKPMVCFGFTAIA